VGELYQIVEKKDSQALAGFLSRNGQALLPIVELIEQGQMVVEEFIEVLGRAALEAVLELSASQLAGPPGRPCQGPEAIGTGSRSSTTSRWATAQPCRCHPHAQGRPAQR